MKSPELNLSQEKSKDPRVLEIFNALRANPKNTIMETLFDVAVFAVENIDLREILTKAKEHIDLLELKLAALSGEKSDDILKAVVNELDLQSRTNEMEGRIKGTYPALTIDEATNGWAMMTIHLRDAVAQLTDARYANAELATQLAAAQRGILTAHDRPSVMTNNDPSFQYSATDPRIKFLVEEFAKIPGLTLDMAVDRWAMYSFGLSELRLELERYKEDSKKKHFAANANAEAALELHGAKVVRHERDSKKGMDGVAGKKMKTIAVRDAVFKWCNDHRREYPYCKYFAINIAEWYLAKDPTMKIRATTTLRDHVIDWGKQNNFERR